MGDSSKLLDLKKNKTVDIKKNKSVTKPKNSNQEKNDKSEIKPKKSIQEENEDQFTEEFLKKELMIYLNFLSDIETKFRVQGYLPLLQKLNYKDEKSVENFQFVLKIMISNLKRILKMSSRKENASNK